MTEIILTAKGDRWARTGHPWVYQDDLACAEKTLSGQIVRVKTASGRLLGQAFYNAKSKIALRWLTHGDAKAEEEINEAFWASRLQAALEYRQRLAIDSTAYRLIHSEADGFPGLIVDRYNDVLVFQVLSLGMDRILPSILSLFAEKLHPQAVVARNDSSVRTLEGLPQEKKLLAGTPPGRVEVQEGNLRYLVNVLEGQKTGLFLDQRENRLYARNLSKGRVLDAFAYQGGFSLQTASSAQEVLAIEDSESAVTHLKENLVLNRISNVKVEKNNAFDRLKELEKSKEQFDLVILDPPAFAKSRLDVGDAWRGYREINLRALRILKPAGTLISCSCSYQISDEIFTEILREASRDAGRRVRLLEQRTQSKDHPIIMTHPESKYLKCFVLEAA